MIQIQQTEAYAKWFSGLRDRVARARIDIRIRRLSLGNAGDAKPVGDGVSELRVDHGSGTGSISSSAVRLGSSCWPEETRPLRTRTSATPRHWQKI